MVYCKHYLTVKGSKMTTPPLFCCPIISMLPKKSFFNDGGFGIGGTGMLIRVFREANFGGWW